MRARFVRQALGADDEEPCIGPHGGDSRRAIEEQIETALREIAGRHETHERRAVVDVERAARGGAQLRRALERITPRVERRIENGHALARQPEMLAQRFGGELRVRDDDGRSAERAKELPLALHDRGGERLPEMPRRFGATLCTNTAPRSGSIDRGRRRRRLALAAARSQTPNDGALQAVRSQNLKAPRSPRATSALRPPSTRASIVNSCPALLRASTLGR
jgi:hypothetical protein